MSDDRFKVDPDRFVFNRRAFLKGALAAPVIVPAVVAAVAPTVSTAALPVTYAPTMQPLGVSRIMSASPVSVSVSYMTMTNFVGTYW